jgi:Zn-dependent protease
VDPLGIETLVLGAAWYVVLLFSLTVHEAAHAWAALRGGDATAYRGGQVSLDPVPHVRREPFGTVVVPILVFAMSGGGWMFGWASTPFDPAWARAHPRRAGWMSLAGPAANLVVCVLAFAALRAGMAGGLFLPEYAGLFHLVGAHEGSLWREVGMLLSILFSLNLLLFVFNLFPVPPLDGSGALSLLVPDEYTAVKIQDWLSQPGLSLVGLMAAWYLFPSLFAPVRDFALELLYRGAG